MTLTVASVPVSFLTPLREAHFARLGEGPELYLELMLRTADAYSLSWKGQPAGYCLRTRDGLLAELELSRSVWSVKSELFSQLVDTLPLSGARVFSFDSLLLGLCFERGWTAVIEGPLFRDLLDRAGPPRNEHLRLRLATPDDIAAILPHREGVFDTEEECREWVARGCVSVLEGDGRFLGIGLLSRVWPSRPEHDVGVMVHPDHRGRGYASYILRALKRRCLDEGMRPTAGCAAENTASARALSRAGFASQHVLMKIRPPGV